MIDRLIQYRSKVLIAVQEGNKLHADVKDEFSFNSLTVCVNNLFSARASAEAFERQWQLHLLVTEDSKVQESKKILKHSSAFILRQSRLGGSTCQASAETVRNPKVSLWLASASELIFELPHLVD